MCGSQWDEKGPALMQQVTILRPLSVLWVKNNGIICMWSVWGEKQMLDFCLCLSAPPWCEWRAVDTNRTDCCMDSFPIQIMKFKRKKIAEIEVGWPTMCTVKFRENSPQAVPLMWKPTVTVCSLFFDIFICFFFSGRTHSYAQHRIPNRKLVFRSGFGKAGRLLKCGFNSDQVAPLAFILMSCMETENLWGLFSYVLYLMYLLFTPIMFHTFYTDTNFGHPSCPLVYSVSSDSGVLLCISYL